MLTPSEASAAPTTDSAPSGASPAELPPHDKVKRGIKLTDAEKGIYREWLKTNPFTPKPKKEPGPPRIPKEDIPVSLEDLEGAQDRILKRITKGVQQIQAKDLPKMLEIVRTAIQERRGKGEKTKADEEAKPPTREEMLAKVAGRRAQKVDASTNP